uniref:RNase H type-1 domain-containing protein n=1 Tax=Manihot esculenta TaxID=3983 RepID=A0A2C9WGX3_MANES
MTNLERYRRGFTSYQDCSVCGAAEESMLHILRDCPLAQQLRDWHCQLRHCYREANKVADYLANQAVSSWAYLEILLQSPAAVASLLLWDQQVLASPRIVGFS